MTIADRARQRMQARSSTNGQAAASPTAFSTQRPSSIESFTAVELLCMELPEPRCIVDGIIPEGLSLLAGKPKLGKSWMALNLCLAVAHGGVALGSIPVEAGDALYISLEDTKRRLQDRLRKILGNSHQSAPARLTLATQWPRQDRGGLAALIEWLDEHRETRLVVNDTWGRFRPPKQVRRDPYEEDSEHAGELKEIADKFHVAIVPVAHCRKMEASDPVDSVSGSIGLTCAADGVLVLKRERGQREATLFISGRELEERELGVRWDANYGLWSILGDAQQCRVSKERNEVLELLANKPMEPLEVAKALGKNRNTVRSLLCAMAADGQLLNLGDGYTIHPDFGANSANGANTSNKAGSDVPP